MYGGCAMDIATLGIFAALQHLDTMRVDIGLQGEVPGRTIRDGFHSLEELGLRGSSKDIETLMREMSLPHLEDLDISVEGGIGAEPFKNFLGSLRSVLPATLTKMELFPDIFPAHLPTLSLADMLEPMFTLRDLEFLNCQFQTYPRTSQTRTSLRSLPHGQSSNPCGSSPTTATSRYWLIW
ncbi:hypothetical protein L226DRAFT_537460 [Lentinus tigrinus ALCF2SS1-7]|nr:hypothetical protein L226DRAFT_537460 [Lentinus tigrinus ALCF2SS1-7]